jgi:Peptidase family M23
MVAMVHAALVAVLVVGSSSAGAVRVVAPPASVFQPVAPVVAPPAPVVGPLAPVVEPVAPAPRAGFRWPLAGQPAVIGPFDPPAEPWLPGHRGVDLSASPGQTVLAAGSGTVAYAGRIAGIGVVSIVHAGGLRTTYEPVASAIYAGAAVAAGTPLGAVSGRLPHCPATCLHWGLIRSGDYLDPLMLLGRGAVRLLPTGPILGNHAAARTRGSPAARRSYSSGWL